MTPEEMKKLFEQLQSAFAEFKQANDERLKAVETKGHADPLLDEKVEKLNGEITRLQGEISAINTAANRVQLASGASQSGQVFDPRTREQRAMTNAEVEHAKACDAFLRKGHGDNDGTLREIERKAMTAGDDPNGGYLLSAPAQGRMILRVYETTPWRNYCHVETISGGKLEGDTDLSEAGAGWTGETNVREETDTPSTGKYAIEPHEMYAQPKISQRMLDDAAYDVEQWLANKAASKFSRLENSAFAIGDGVNKPRGIFSYPTLATADSTRAWGKMQHIVTGNAGAFAAAGPGDVLINAIYSLKPEYRAGAAWAMQRLTVAEVRKLKDANAQYLWQPGLAPGQPATLLQYPVIEAEDVPAIAANALAIAFGNFREGYTIVDRIGIRVLRDPFTSKPFVKFYTTKRTGGDVVNTEAIKFVKFSA